jgi:hypothetical protein
MCAVVVYTAIAAFQWSQMKRAVDVAQEQFQTSERPRIGVSRIDAELDPTRPTKIDIKVVNAGNGPAIDLTARHVVECVMHGDRPKFLDSEPSLATVIGVLVPNADLQIRHVSICKTRQGIADVFSGKLDLFVYGTIWYKDSFGKKHRTHFCNSFDPASESMTVCREHTGAD